MKIGETIKRLLRRKPPPTEALAAPTEAERRRANEAVLTAQIEAEKLRASNDLSAPF